MQHARRGRARCQPRCYKYSTVPLTQSRDLALLQCIRCPAAPAADRREVSTSSIVVMLQLLSIDPETSSVDRDISADQYTWDAGAVELRHPPCN